MEQFSMINPSSDESNVCLLLNAIMNEIFHLFTKRLDVRINRDRQQSWNRGLSSYNVVNARHFMNTILIFQITLDFIAV